VSRLSIRMLIVAVVVLAGIYACAAVAYAQTTRTYTLTQTTSVSFTNTFTNTITSQTVIYTTTTETQNSTLAGTATIIQPSLTTLTSTYTVLTSGILTETVSAILTQVPTEATQLLGNIWGESLAAALFLAAVASLVAPKLHSRRPKGLVCRSCGTRNPPFAMSFCVKCGQPLHEK